MYKVRIAQQCTAKNYNGKELVKPLIYEFKPISGIETLNEAVYWAYVTIVAAATTLEEGGCTVIDAPRLADRNCVVKLAKVDSGMYETEVIIEAAVVEQE